MPYIASPITQKTFTLRVGGAMWVAFLARHATKFKLTYTKLKLKVKGINAKSLIGIRTPLKTPESKRAHLMAAFFVPAHIFLIWWRGMGNLRVGRSLGGSSNLYRVITRKFELSLDGLKKPFTRGHSHV